MSGLMNFNREYRLSAGQAGKQGFEIGHKSLQQPVPLHIAFSLQKADLQTPNTGKVTIWNLNKAHLAVLDEKDCVLSLRAGYGTHMPLIFAGTVSFATTTDDGADRKTEIEVVDSIIAIRDTYVSVSYNGRVSWERIFDDVAAQMGVAISYSYNAPSQFKNVMNGFSFVGKARDVLTRGCNSCNLAWSVQNGVLQIKRPKDVMSKEVYVLSPDNGLIGTPARVIEEDDAGGKSQGWDVEYFLNGAINIDDYVRLESKTATGYFRVYSIELQGDNIAGDWLCKARLLEV